MILPIIMEVIINERKRTDPLRCGQPLLSFYNTFFSNRLISVSAPMTMRMSPSRICSSACGETMISSSSFNRYDVYSEFSPNI